MKVIVLKVSEWRQSIKNDALYKRITFEIMDQPGKYVHLNLTQNCAPIKWQQWLPYLKPGNVLDVTMQSNNRNVNQFQHFYPINIKERNKV